MLNFTGVKLKVTTYDIQEVAHVAFFLTAASQLRAVTITRSCVAVTIVETDDANCDGFTFVSTDAVVAVHKSIDYLYS